MKNKIDFLKNNNKNESSQIWGPKWKNKSVLVYVNRWWGEEKKRAWLVVVPTERREGRKKGGIREKKNKKK